MKEIFMDIHSHIIPGVDDGSDSMEETMEMIKQAYAEGVRAIIATPHYGVINHDYSSSEAYGTLIEVVKQAKAECPGMKFIMGNEIYYTKGIAEDILDGKARCLGDSSYVLVEFSTAVEYGTIKQALEEFMFNGFRPIIAHLERYDCLKNNIEAVKELVEFGAYVQINCRSVTGKGTKLENRAKWCRKLLDEELVHFIASDCHDSRGRKPEFLSAVRTMKKHIGEEKTKKIVNGNILSLIKDERIN